MLFDWNPLGRAKEEESILNWMMQEYEHLDIVMDEAEGRRRQDDAKMMEEDDTKVFEYDIDDDMKIDETEQEINFEEVREVTELGYDVDTSDWGQDDLNGAWDDLDEVPDDVTHGLTIEVVADSYFKGGTWYLNNWREVPLLVRW